MKPEWVLVTGATGFLGGALIRRLIKEGYLVRALARRTSRTVGLGLPGVQTVYGDMTDVESVREAVSGMDVVVHAAAGVDSNGSVVDSATVQGARNLIQVLPGSTVRKLIYISTCSVYGISKEQRGAILTEESPLEERPWLRGSYTNSKVVAEALIRASMGAIDCAIVVLRPGTVYGPGGGLLPPMLGYGWREAVFIVIGSGEFELPMIYIDDAIDAISKSIACPEANNRVFNVVDSERVTKTQYVERFLRRALRAPSVIYLPYWMVSGLVAIGEWLARLAHCNPLLTRYRLVASQTQVRYDNTTIRNVLSWEPRVSFSEAVERILAGRTAPAPSYRRAVGRH